MPRWPRPAGCSVGSGRCPRGWGCICYWPRRCSPGAVIGRGGAPRSPGRGGGPGPRPARGGRVGARMIAGLEGLTVPAPSAAGLAGARRRVGAAPLRALFELLRGPAAGPATAGVWWHGRLICALDGTTLCCPDTPANLAIYCKGGSHHGGTGYPMVRLLAVVACGTRALLATAFGTTSRGEPAYAAEVVAALHPGMLLLADRNFAAAELIAGIDRAGADLLIRVKAGRQLPVCRRCGDGSWISRIGPVEVRVIRCTNTVTTPAGRRSEIYQLVTTVTDPDCPATELVTLYHQRWEIEMRHLWCWSSRVRLSSESAFWGGCRCGRLGPAGPGVVAGWAGAAFAQPGQFGRVGMDDPERVVRHLLGGQPAAVDPVVDGGHGHAQLGGQPGHRPPIRAQAGDRGRRGAGARSADAVLVDQ